MGEVGQRLAVGEAELGVDVDGAQPLGGHDGGVDEIGGHDHVPDEVRELGILGEHGAHEGLFQNAGLGAAAEGHHEAVVVALPEDDLFADVEAEDHLLGEGAPHDDLGRLGVDPPVELGGRGDVALLEEGSAHVDHALHEGHDVGGHADGAGEVGEGADGRDGDFVGIGPDGVDDEVDGVLVGGLVLGLHAVAAPVELLPAFGLAAPEGAEPGVVAHAELGPFAFEELVALRAQGVLHALVQGDAAAFDFEVPCGVGDAFLHPAVAGDAGDAHEIDVRRVGQHDHGHAVVEHLHHVGVEQDLFLFPAFRLSRKAGRSPRQEGCEGKDGEGGEDGGFEMLHVVSFRQPGVQSAGRCGAGDARGSRKRAPAAAWSIAAFAVD